MFSFYRRHTVFAHVVGIIILDLHLASPGRMRRGQRQFRTTFRRGYRNTRSSSRRWRTAVRRNPLFTIF